MLDCFIFSFPSGGVPLMKRIILNYNLEVFSFVILMILLIRFLFYPSLSMEHRILSAFMITAILHEYEEKRIPGGFYELMANKFRIPEERRHFEKAGLCVTIYWTVLLVTASVFPHPALLTTLSTLGIFEAFIHTAGILIHKLRKPYTPGLVTAWIMAAVSIVTLRYLAADSSVGTGTYITGIILFLASFLVLETFTIHSFGMKFRDLRNNLTGR